MRATRERISRQTESRPASPGGFFAAYEPQGSGAGLGSRLPLLAGLAHLVDDIAACDDAAEHCQKNAEEGNIMYPIHMLHHSPSLSLDNRMISSIFSVP